MLLSLLNVIMSNWIDFALYERAVRLVREHRVEYLSNARALAAVARQEGVGAQSLHRWVVRTDIDAGDRDGRTSVEHESVFVQKRRRSRFELHSGFRHRASGTAII